MVFDFDMGRSCKLQNTPSLAPGVFRLSHGAPIGAGALNLA
jgi:hypothetical protein